MTNVDNPTTQNLMTAQEAASAFDVDPTVIVDWYQSGFLSPIRVPGGNRRFLVEEIARLVDVRPRSVP